MGQQQNYKHVSGIETTPIGTKVKLVYSCGVGPKEFDKQIAIIKSDPNMGGWVTILVWGCTSSWKNGHWSLGEDAPILSKEEREAPDTGVPKRLMMWITYEK